jgi:hypothetical protein
MPDSCSIAVMPAVDPGTNTVTHAALFRGGRDLAGDVVDVVVAARAQLDGV